MKSTDDKTLNNETLSRLMDGEWQDLKAGECLAGVCKSESMKGAWERYHLIRDVIRNEPVAPETTLCDRISAAIADEPTYSNVHSIGAPAGTPVLASTAPPVDATTTENPGDTAALVGESVAPGTTVPSSDRSTTLKTVARGFALAASVAAVTVLGLSVWQGGSLPSGDSAGNQLASDATRAEGERQASAVGLAGDEANEVFARQTPGSTLPEVDFVANTASYWVSPETTERSASEGRLNMFLSQHIEHSPTADHQGMFPYSRLVGYEPQVTE